MIDKLSDCPFCRAPASIGKIGRDWWELKAEHDEECALDSDHVLRAPQTPEGRAWLVTAWNRRASPAPAIPMPPLNDAMRAVLTNENCIYGTPDELYAALVMAAPAISESDLLALLPGTTYMDEPDGGSLSLLEQLQRMAKDAGRYRWLRDENRETPDGTRELMAVQYRLPFSEGTDTELFDTALDAAIDAALAGEKS
ncbi:hypothetical protein [Burkholderia gladioli]|uniref:hypothetical protein n=1 Tax=Burkholderia gladioli TaxID=28095 RepID=UPI0016406874|nr:hypothetical protein [Burkholderia gladioli]